MFILESGRRSFHVYSGNTSKTIKSIILNLNHYLGLIVDGCALHKKRNSFVDILRHFSLSIFFKTGFLGHIIKSVRGTI